jgi:hypothetical protein
MTASTRDVDYHLRTEKNTYTTIHIPCLIIRTGRKIVYRLVGYNDSLKHALNFFWAMRQPGFS